MSDPWDDWNAGSTPAYPHAKAVQFALRAFAPGARRGVRALDLGCGSGNNTWFLAREGFEVTALDASPVAIATARDRLARDGLSASLRCEDATRIADPDDSFALSLCIGVLDALGPGRAALALAEMQRTLAPGGRAMALFMAADDFRTTRALPFPLHGYARGEVETLAAAVPGARIGRYLTDYGDGQAPQSDWIVSWSKP